VNKYWSNEVNTTVLLTLLIAQDSANTATCQEIAAELPGHGDDDVAVYVEAAQNGSASSMGRSAHYTHTHTHTQASISLLHTVVIQKRARGPPFSSLNTKLVFFLNAACCQPICFHLQKRFVGYC